MHENDIIYLMKITANQLRSLIKEEITKVSRDEKLRNFPGDRQMRPKKEIWKNGRRNPVSAQGISGGKMTFIKLRPGTYYVAPELTRSGNADVSDYPPLEVTARNNVFKVYGASQYDSTVVLFNVRDKSMFGHDHAEVYMCDEEDIVEYSDSGSMNLEPFGTPADRELFNRTREEARNEKLRAKEAKKAEREAFAKWKTQQR